MYQNDVMTTCVRACVRRTADALCTQLLPAAMQLAAFDFLTFHAAAAAAEMVATAAAVYLAGPVYRLAERLPGRRAASAVN